MNKKGIMSVSAAFGYGALGLCVAAAGLTGSFRERKANQFCQAEGFGAETCEVFVSQMGKSEILDYIKDDGKNKSITDY